MNKDDVLGVAAMTINELADINTELQAENERLKFRLGNYEERADHIIRFIINEGLIKSDDIPNELIVKVVVDAINMLQAENERLRYVIKTVLMHCEKDPVMRVQTELRKMMLDAVKGR